MPKKPIIIISVLCIIALALGYWSGQGKEEVASSSDVKSSEKKEPEFLRDGLVAYYPFDGSLKDESGNGNDGGGSLTSFSTDRNGRPNKSYLFKNDTIQLNNQTLVENSVTTEKNMSVSFWAAKSTKGVIISQYWQGYSERTNMQIVLARPEGAIEVYGNGKDRFHFKFAPSNFDWNQWVVAYNSSANNVNVYMNGNLIAAGKVTLNSNASATGFLLGSTHNPTPGDRLEGELDDLRIYNRALSAGEVKALYEFEKAN